MRFQSGKFWILSSLWLFAVLSTAETQPFHYSDQHENLFKSNPASIANVESLSFQLTYRNQWPGNSDFVTYDGSAIISSEALKSSLGVYAFRDVQGEGIISQTGASLMYAYRTRISPEMRLSAGIMAAFAQYQTNFSGLVFENSLPVADENYLHIDFSTGIELQFRETAWFGIAVNKLGAYIPNQSDHLSPSISAYYQGHIGGSGGYSKGTITWEPLVYTAISRDAGELLFGGRMNYQNVYGGLYLRQNYRFQYDAAIILLGTRFGNAEMFYTYDINLSGVNSNFTNLAAHEVTFLYHLEYNTNNKSKSRKHGAIKCPKI
ncbi:MAG: PorP/SprF family type IX secretion system membrane protein [Bacteroidales bacterium]|nr:PorP/SprF family type IX secretion system membrane protein [Bacteroidales bacterium]